MMDNAAGPGALQLSKARCIEALIEALYACIGMAYQKRILRQF